MKWLGRALLASLALLFLMAAAAAWIVNTQAGSSWALRRAAALSPQPLTFGAIEGTIAGALVLHELRYGGDDSRLTLSAQRVRLQLALGDLLGGAIHVEAAQVADLFVSMRDKGARERERPDAPPDLRPPLDLVVDHQQQPRREVTHSAR